MKTCSAVILIAVAVAVAIATAGCGDEIYQSRLIDIAWDTLAAERPFTGTTKIERGSMDRCGLENNATVIYCATGYIVYDGRDRDIRLFRFDEATVRHNTQTGMWRADFGPLEEL